MLETDERDATAAHDELSGIGRAHAHHQVEINGTVRFQYLGRATQRVLRDRDDVHGLEQPLQIRSVGAQRVLDDRLSVR